MEVRELQYKKLVSFRDYGNEEFRVVVGVMPGEDADEVADAARVMVDAALKRSQRERDFVKKVANLKNSIAHLSSDLSMSDEAYIAQFKNTDADKEWLERQLQSRAEKRLWLAASERMLAELERIGPAGDFEAVGQVANQDLTENIEDEDDEYIDGVAPF